jgi:hypothetical protein
MTKKQLSPAAEAIWEAYNEDEPGVFVDYADCLAAALRALVKQKSKEYLVTEQNLEIHYEYQTYIEVVCVDDILCIANELDGRTK